MFAQRRFWIVRANEFVITYKVSTLKLAKQKTSRNENKHFCNRAEIYFVSLSTIDVCNEWWVVRSRFAFSMGGDSREAANTRKKVSWKTPPDNEKTHSKVIIMELTMSCFVSTHHQLSPFLRSPMASNKKELFSRQINYSTKMFSVQLIRKFFTFSHEFWFLSIN